MFYEGVGMVASRTEQNLHELLEPFVEEQGYELTNIEYKKEGIDWFLRLFIDGENGVGLEDCQKVSRAVGDKLDMEDPIPHSYTLEVSSPGVERPLKKERDFHRFEGELVQIRTFSPVSGQKNFRGKLEGFKDGEIHLETDGNSVAIPLENVSKAHLLVEF